MLPERLAGDVDLDDLRWATPQLRRRAGQCRVLVKIKQFLFLKVGSYKRAQALGEVQMPAQHALFDARATRV